MGQDNPVDLTEEEAAKFEAWYASRKQRDDRKAKLDKVLPEDVREAFRELIREENHSFLKELLGGDEGTGGDDTSRGRPRPEGADPGKPRDFLTLLGVKRTGTDDE